MDVGDLDLELRDPRRTQHVGHHGGRAQTDPTGRRVQIGSVTAADENRDTLQHTVIRRLLDVGHHIVGGAAQRAAQRGTEGRKQSLDDVVAEVRRCGLPLVELTGGEPLLQKQAVPLMQRLLDEGYTVLLETGGHISIADVPSGVHRIVDVKCPGSGESDRVHWANLDLVTTRDEVKFVIADRADFEYARDVVRTYALAGRCGAIHFSPAWGHVEPADLAAWILEERLPVRLQLQQHKYIWAPAARRV